MPSIGAPVGDGGSTRGYAGGAAAATTATEAAATAEVLVPAHHLLDAARRLAGPATSLRDDFIQEGTTPTLHAHLDNDNVVSRFIDTYLTAKGISKRDVHYKSITPAAIPPGLAGFVCGKMIRLVALAIWRDAKDGYIPPRESHLN